MDGLTPFRVGASDHGYIVHLMVAAEDILDLGRVNVLAARDNHVVLAVDQGIEAVDVAPGHIANGQIRASECLRGFVRQIPIAFETPGCSRIELADLAFAHLAAVFVEKLNPAAATQLAPDRAKLAQLLGGPEQRGPALLG